PRGCRGVRRRLALPGAGEGRAARLGGLEGRDDAQHGAGAQRMSEQPVREHGTPTAANTPSASRASVEDVEEAMRDVVDPELGINVVDLGLVYGVTLDDANTATIDMTLTSAACPLTDVIEDQTAESLSGIVDDFRINWVW